MSNNPLFSDKKDKKVESQTELVLAQSLKEMVELFKGITEFNNRQLLPISLLQTDKYFAELLSFYIENKKHIKRKYAKEIIIIFEHIAKTIGARLNDSQLESEKGFMNLFRNNR